MTAIWRAFWQPQWQQCVYWSPSSENGSNFGWLTSTDTLRSFTRCFRKSSTQRLPSVAAGSWVHGAWHEAVIGLPGSAEASMTGIEGAAVIQLGRPQVTPSDRDRTSAARRAEL